MHAHYDRGSLLTTQSNASLAKILLNNDTIEEKGVLQEATASAEDRIGKAKEEMQQKMMQARQSLEKEVEAFSQDLAEKILGRKVS